MYLSTWPVITNVLVWNSMVRGKIGLSRLNNVNYLFGKSVIAKCSHELLFNYTKKHVNDSRGQMTWVWQRVMPYYTHTSQSDASRQIQNERNMPRQNMTDLKANNFFRAGPSTSVANLPRWTPVIIFFWIDTLLGKKKKVQKTRNSCPHSF